MTYSLNAQFLVFLIIFSLVSCTSTKVSTSTVEEGYTGKVETVLFVVQFSDDIDKAIPAFSKRTKELLDPNDLPYEISVRDDSASFNESVLKNIQQEASSRGFTHILFIGDFYLDTYYEYKKGVPLYQDGDTEPIVVGRGYRKVNNHGVEGLLIDLQEDKKVWKAHFNVESGIYGSSKQTGKSLAAAVIEKLMKDSLLPAGFVFPHKYSTD